MANEAQNVRPGSPSEQGLGSPFAPYLTMSLATGSFPARHGAFAPECLCGEVEKRRVVGPMANLYNNADRARHARSLFPETKRS